LKRKLTLLNAVLMFLLAILVLQYRNIWLEARDREARTLRYRVAPEKAVPLPALAPFAPAIATNYIDVAQKMLFAKDRNPNVIIVPPAPPAEKPMPALPKYYGLMGFGRPGIILGDKGVNSQKTYHAGEKVGDFTLVTFDRGNIELEWEGKKIEKRLEELADKSGAPAGASNAQNVPAAAAASAAPPVVNLAPLGPGTADLGNNMRSCQANDSTPSGTVRDGMRKVETVTPFGKSCRWEPTK
jgi:hypothetical protein